VMGVLLSPDIMGHASAYLPGIASLGISNPESLSHIAELGVVFLLFLIGIEMSFERLSIMRRLVFGLGGLQVLLCMAGIASAALALGFDMRAALVAGAALCLSSTAIVVQLLSDAKRLGSQTGRTSFAILLLQDLAVIPLLLLVPILGQRSEATSWSASCLPCFRPPSRWRSSCSSGATCSARCCASWRAPGAPTCSWRRRC